MNTCHWFLFSITVHFAFETLAQWCFVGPVGLCLGLEGVLL